MWGRTRTRTVRAGQRAWQRWARKARSAKPSEMPPSSIRVRAPVAIALPRLRYSELAISCLCCGVATAAISPDSAGLGSRKLSSSPGAWAVACRGRCKVVSPRLRASPGRGEGRPPGLRGAVCACARTHGQHPNLPPGRAWRRQSAQMRRRPPATPGTHRGRAPTTQAGRSTRRTRLAHCPWCLHPPCLGRAGRCSRGPHCGRSRCAGGGAVCAPAGPVRNLTKSTIFFFGTSLRQYVRETRRFIGKGGNSHSTFVLHIPGMVVSQQRGVARYIGFRGCSLGHEQHRYLYIGTLWRCVALELTDPVITVFGPDG